MANSWFPSYPVWGRRAAYRLRGMPGAVGLAILLLISGTTSAVETAYNEAPASRAEGTAELQEVPELLLQDESFFAPIIGDIELALAEIADVPAMTWQTLDGGAPHLVLFVEGKSRAAGREHPVLQTMRALAGNYQLALEYQSTFLSDGAILFGFMLYQRFPTLEMAWETHPYESVASEGGAWLPPFADLADVESVHVTEDRATLVFSASAARRIDALSEIHGHRTYRLRGVEMANAADLGTYTWVPGLRSVPGVPVSFTCRLPRRSGQWKEGVSLEYLRQRFAIHASARARIVAELNLPEDLSWTISMAPSRYAEPFYCWVVHAPEAGGKATQLPWYQADSTVARRWLHVQAPESPGGSAIIPRHWEFMRTGGGAGFSTRPATSAEGGAQEEAFASFLRQNLGREMAIVMQGQVAGVLSISTVRPEVLALNNVPAAAADAMDRLWRAANAAPADAESLQTDTRTATAANAAPDSFQVRLMAEPQDREIIPVTHFAAPGSAAGTVVAVQNDIILDGHAVTSAELENKDEKLFLRITFTPEALEALGGACFGNMGKQLAIIYNDRLVCAPTIDDWELEELSFKGMDQDWAEVALDLAKHLGAKG